MAHGGSTTLDDLLCLALARDPHYNQQRLGNQAYRYTRRITNRSCRDLPEDLHDEIFHQAFAELFSMDPAVIGALSQLQAFRRAVFAAIRAVRANNAPPGQRTRYSTKTAKIPAKVAAEDVGRILNSREYDACFVFEGDNRVLDLDLAPSATAAETILQIEDRVSADIILAHATPEVRTALSLIHISGESTDSVAAMMGMTRFSLNRRIAAFTADWRFAA